MDKEIQSMINHTDLIPWYWLSYGEKCYAFATVEAFPLNESDPVPAHGSRLEQNEDGEWVGENGTKMLIESWIADIEQQNGDTICSFIAAAHAKLLGENLG